MLAVCCQAVVSCPSEEQMKKGNRITRAALNTQVLTSHSFSTSESGAHLSTPWQCMGVLQNLSSPFLLLASAQEGHARFQPSHRNPSGDTGSFACFDDVVHVSSPGARGRGSPWQRIKSLAGDSR